MQYGALESTFYFNFAVNDNTGDQADGVVGTAYVRLKGAAADAAPVYSATPYLLTHANYPDGCVEVAIPATAVNGFAGDSEYAVYCDHAVSAVYPNGMIGEFITTALADDTELAESVSAKLQTDMQADPTDFHVNVMEVNGTAQTANDNGADINTILSRIIGTLLAGDHNPQSGDGYAIVNSGTFGNSILNEKLNTIDDFIDTEITSIITHLTDIKGAGWTTQTLQAIITALATKPTSAEVNAACDTAIADAALSSQTSVDTIDGIVDSLLIIAQKLDTALELDGAVYKFTANALEEAPTGVGGFTTDDRNDLQAIDAITAILATMYEDSAGYRFKAKALEQAPVTSVTGLATTAHVQEVEDKLDIVDTNVDSTLADTAEMQTKLDTIDSNVDSVLEDTGSAGVKVMDVETGLTHAHAMQILVALGCLMDGGGTSTIHARNYEDTKNRITWIVDENGNRTGITFNFD
jgi:hypothetical protein